MGLLIKVWREDRRRNKTILEFYPFGYFVFGLGKLYTCSYFFLCVYFSLLYFVFYVLTLSWSTDLMQSSHSSWFLCSIPFFLESLFRILLVFWLGVFDLMLFSSGSPSISPLCFCCQLSGLYILHGGHNFLSHVFSLHFYSDSPHTDTSGPEFSPDH